LSGFVLQAIGLGTALWPTLSSKKLASLSVAYSIVLVVSSVLCMAASLCTYFWVSCGWGPLLSFFGAIAQPFILLQVIEVL